MSVQGINISLAEVTSTANRIRSVNTNLLDKLKEIKTEMNSLTSTWQSEASDTAQNKFNALESKFTNYYDIIQAYATFLDTTVTNYDAAETKINANASAFK
ncbi:pore-forming ESAT-6 family protein [Paenibacillus alginolyticus]|uniref:ESAT-6-like protein n=1 Tax=Paenibacillus alginolyticus TaxID=59839 RepID=A0ABT4G7A3_9BACL|nr:pore-forming ESAT-6 family protein [Paenibacillus alginolyticus]MCY9692057.1 pore-forming ESAT-6 family protein [Paenibacillus alginolyticus]MEC0144247.1 pore-forming ESAT-6 family protein [Paenibacillus alginolyticus]